MQDAIAQTARMEFMFGRYIIWPVPKFWPERFERFEPAPKFCQNLFGTASEWPPIIGGPSICPRWSYVYGFKLWKNQSELLNHLLCIRHDDVSEMYYCSQWVWILPQSLNFVFLILFSCGVLPKFYGISSHSTHVCMYDFSKEYKK